MSAFLGGANFESEEQTARRLLKEMMDLDASEPIQRAVAMVRKMQSNGDIMREACYAFAYKAITHGRQIVEEGGLELVLTAMNRHGRHEALQYDGCETLWRLSMDEDLAQKVLDAGGLTAVLAALAMNEESIRVMEEATGTLRWLAARDAKRVLDGGGLEACIRVMENLPQFSWVQMWGCGAMGSFAEVDAKSVQDLGGFTVVQAAMAKHKDSKEVMRLGTEALKFDPATRKTLERTA